MAAQKQLHYVSVFCSPAVERHGYCLFEVADRCLCSCHYQSFGEEDIFKLAFQLRLIQEFLATSEESEREERFRDIVLATVKTLDWHGSELPELCERIQSVLQRNYRPPREDLEELED